jgi:hypothetical protein
MLARWLGRPGFVPNSLVDPQAMIGAIEERALWARWGL